MCALGVMVAGGLATRSLRYAGWSAPTCPRPKPADYGVSASHDLVVQVPVGRDRAAPGRPVGAVEIGEPPARLGDDDRRRGQVVQRHLRLGRDVDCALGHQHVGPEVAVGAGPPDVPGQAEEALLATEVVPARQARVGQRRVVEAGHPGDGHPAGRRQALARPGAGTDAGPPATAQRGGADQAGDHHVAVHQGDQGCPDRARRGRSSWCRRSGRAPSAAGRGPCRPELLTGDGVPRPGPGQGGADRLLGGCVGVRDGCQVRLGVDDEVERLEARHGDGVGGVGEDVRQSEVVVVRRHVTNRTSPFRPLQSPPHTSDQDSWRICRRIGGDRWDCSTAVRASG